MELPLLLYFHINRLHYGTNTCDACKIFFKRSIKKSHTYSCINKMNPCQPNEKFTFSCKFCRYQKCVNEGMSKMRIKVGRYSKETHKRNREALQKLNPISNNYQVPMLPEFSDADDVIMRFMIAINNVKGPSWSVQFNSLSKIFDKFIRVVDSGFFPKDDFLNILEVTGLEVDDRKELSNFCDNFMEISLRKWLPILRSLPGLNELEEKPFFHLLCKNIDILHIVMSIPLNMLWKDDGLYISINGKNCIVNNEVLEQLVGSFMTNLRKEKAKIMDRLRIKPEEILFIFSILMLTPNEYFSTFPSAYDRITQALTRYLEKDYRESYQERLSILIDFLSFLNNFKASSTMWRKENSSYFPKSFKTPITRLLCGGLSLEIDQNLGVLKEYLIINS